MNILLCWEDEYYQNLERALKRVKNRVPVTDYSIERRIYSDTAKGYGGFKQFVNIDWAIARKKGILNPRSRGPIDKLVCIADADRAYECCPKIEKVGVREHSKKWLLEAEDSWTTELRTYTNVDPEHVFGKFIRWNRESIVISCFDQLQVIKRLAAKQVEENTLRSFLENCSPNPLVLDNTEFTDTYRDPSSCLLAMMKELGHTHPRKNHINVEDALGAFPKKISDELMHRIPDFVSIAELINNFE